MINTLDGFNLQPRLSIPFDGPIDVNTVNSHNVFLVRMGDTLDRMITTSRSSASTRSSGTRPPTACTSNPTTCSTSTRGMR